MLEFVVEFVLSFVGNLAETDAIMKSQITTPWKDSQRSELGLQMHAPPTCGNACSVLPPAESFGSAPERAFMAEDEPPLLSVEGVSFAHDPADPKQLDGVSFELRRGRTLGILGGNECGKTTLGQLLLGRLAPGAGRVLLDGEPLRMGAARPWWLGCVDALLLLTLAVTLLLLLTPLLSVPLGLAMRDRLTAALAQGAWCPPLFLLVLRATHSLAAARARGGTDDDAAWAPAAMRRRGVAYVSSEHDGGQRLPANMRVEEYLARQMPLPPTRRDARRREVIAALRASGFQMFDGIATPTGRTLPLTLNLTTDPDQ